MYEAKDPEARGIRLPGGMWQCPACGGREKGESRLRMRHGFSSINHSGYWWTNYGACMVMRETLIELGWNPPGSYKRRDMVERGHVFTANQEDQIAYAFRRGGWLHGWVNGGSSLSPEKVGGEVADAMTPLIMGRLDDKMLGEVPLDELEDKVAAVQARIHDNIRTRVSTSVARLMGEYEQQGVAFGTGESLNRALNALVEQYAHVETPEPLSSGKVPA
jgi:hypothetical protein